MRKKTILIADDDKAWCDSLSRYLGLNPAFEILKVVHNGEEAVDLIQDERPDVILIDLIMPVFDGLYVIDLIRNHMYEYKPFIYVISALDIERTHKLLASLSVGYYSVKPIHPKVVSHNLYRLLDLDSRPEVAKVTTRPPSDLQDEIEDYLYELGAPLNLMSTRCLRSILRVFIERNDLGRGMSEVYRFVGDTENLKPGAVERNVRSVIGHLQKNNTEYFQKCFPEGGQKLTNTAFIAQSAYLIKKRLEEPVELRVVGER